MSEQHQKYKLWKHRSGVYYVVWAGVSGTRRVSTGSKSSADAEAYLSQFIAGTEALSAPTNITISAILEKYLEDRKPVVRSWGSLKYAAKPLVEHLGNLEPKHLGNAVIRTYASKRKLQGVVAGTIIREIVTLRAALRLAEAEGWIKSAPHLRMPVTAPQPKDTWITREQATRLLECCAHPHIKLYIMLGLYTTARHGAILRLRWEQVDLSTGIINFGQGHGNKRRTVLPINERLHQALLEAQQLAQTEHVIEWRDKPVRSIKRAFKSACAAAGITGITPHALRHTGATWLALAGVKMSEIARYLGDSEDTVERVYAKYHPDYLKKSANLLQL